MLTSLSLVVHSAALSFSGLASCLLHSVTLLCPRPRGLERHCPTGRGCALSAPEKYHCATPLDESVCIHHDVLNLASASTRPFLKLCTFSENCSPAFNSAVSLFVMNDSRCCLTCLLRQARHHLFFALNIKANFIRLCIEPRHATLSCLTQGLLSLYHNRDFYHSTKNLTCGTSTVF